MMKVSAVSFTSGAAPKCSKNVAKTNAQPCASSYNRVSDILPLTVGLGAGLMVAYALKTGKLDPVAQKIKGFMKIA